MSNEVERLLNQSQFKTTLIKQLNTELMEAMEPEIKKALEVIEKKMRTQLAANIIAAIDAHFSYERMAETIVFSIRR